MFSRDPRCYRATPRTVQQAFGPYATSMPPVKRRKSKLFTLALAAASLSVMGLVTMAIANL